MTNSSSKSFPGMFIFICNLCFLLLYIILAYYNRFAVDDYFYINNEHVNGIWGGMTEGYRNWGGRWASYLLWGVIYHFHDLGWVIFVYSISVMAFFILSIYLVLLSITGTSSHKFKKFDLLNYSIFFSGFVFLISFNKGEIWFWVVSTTMYILSISAFLVAMSQIFFKSVSVFRFIIVAICFAFAGGASEVYGMFYLLFLLFLVFLYFSPDKKRDEDNMQKAPNHKLLLGIFILFFALFQSFMAPGNSVRAGWLPETSFFSTFWVTLKSLVKIIIFKVSYQIPWIVLFSIPIMYIGFSLNKTGNKIKLKEYLGDFVMNLSVTVILIYLLLFPACYLLSETGPDRSLSLIVFLIAIFVTLTSFYIGYKCIKSAKFISSLFYVSSAIIVVSLITMSVWQYGIASKYAAALDQRTEYLLHLQEKGNKKTITVDPLPPSGFLYSAEISDDTTYFGNEHYRLGLFLDFKVKKK